MDPSALVSELDDRAIDATIRTLSGDIPAADGPILSRDIHHPDILRAGAWLQDRLQAIDGLAVRPEPFAITGEGTLAGPLYNIIADLPGPEGAPYIVVGAHYDSIASLDPGWTDPAADPAPGAEDDASGDAAILAIAEALAAWEPGYQHPIRFVLFSAEEEGLLGSQAHVEGLTDEVAAMIELDSIGTNAGASGLLWYTYDDQSADLADQFGVFAATTGTPLVPNAVDADLIGGDARSDHWPFWEAGIPALHLASFPLSPDYHTMGDLADTVDPVYTRDVAALTGAWVADLAGPNEAVAEPDPRGCGCEGAAGSPLAALVAALGVILRVRWLTNDRYAPGTPTRSS